MRLIAGVCLVGSLLFTAPSSAAVVDEVIAVATRHGGGGPVLLRTLTIVSLAMFDAANAVDRRYEPYRAQPSPPAGVDAGQAALGAGCAALLELRPQQREPIAKDCGAIDAGATSDQALASRRYGATIGIDHVEARKGDVVAASSGYRPFTAPGVYVPTTLPIGSDGATTKPFALQSPSQFRPGPPPALTSERWIRDYNETRTMGARDRSPRTLEQTATAQFFASAGPQQFLDSMPAIPAGSQSVVERARYYALAYITLFDTGIAIFDAKYAYNFWRPITAIRNGGDDGSATPRDAAWVPLLDTPMHPEYPCAHCWTGTAWAVTVLSLLGDGKPVVLLAAAAAPGQSRSTREYRKVSDLAADVANARVFGGMHFRTSTEVGSAMGTALGEYVIATQLRPLPR